MKPQKIFKKTNIIVGIFVFLIGISVGGYLVLKSETGFASIKEQLSQILEENKASVAFCQPEAENPEKDSDNDGLKDWEEAVYQADPCAPDTDGDGYLDGEEIAAGYDPAKPAPNDELPNRENQRTRTLPKNLTEALAEILGQEIKTGQINPPLGRESNLSSLDSIKNLNLPGISHAFQKAMLDSIQEFSPLNIPDSEIKTSSDNSAAAIQFYAGKIIEIMDNWAEKTSIDQGELFESESQMIYQAIQTGDFSQIDKHIEFYKGVSEDLKQIISPSRFADIHKEQISILKAMSNIFKAIKKIDQDPLKANLALEQYQNTAELTTQMLQKLADRLNEEY